MSVVIEEAKSDKSRVSLNMEAKDSLKKERERMLNDTQEEEL